MKWSNCSSMKMLFSRNICQNNCDKTSVISSTWLELHSRFYSWILVMNIHTIASVKLKVDPKSSQNGLHLDHDAKLEVWRSKHWQFLSSRIKKPEKIRNFLLELIIEMNIQIPVQVLHLPLIMGQPPIPNYCKGDGLNL